MPDKYQTVKDSVLNIHRPEKMYYEHFDRHCRVCDTVWPCKTARVFIENEKENR